MVKPEGLSVWAALFIVQVFVWSPIVGGLKVRRFNPPPYLFAEYMIFVFADPAQTMDVHHKTQEERSIVGADIEILPDIRLSAVRRRIRREVNIEFEEEESV